MLHPGKVHPESQALTNRIVILFREDSLLVGQNFFLVDQNTVKFFLVPLDLRLVGQDFFLVGQNAIEFILIRFDLLLVPKDFFLVAQDILLISQQFVVCHCLVSFHSRFLCASDYRDHPVSSTGGREKGGSHPPSG